MRKALRWKILPLAAGLALLDMTSAGVGFVLANGLRGEDRNWGGAGLLVLFLGAGLVRALLKAARTPSGSTWRDRWLELSFMSEWAFLVLVGVWVSNESKNSTSSSIHKTAGIAALLILAAVFLRIVDWGRNKSVLAPDYTLKKRGAVHTLNSLISAAIAAAAGYFAGYWTFDSWEVGVISGGLCATLWGLGAYRDA